MKHLFIIIYILTACALSAEAFSLRGRVVDATSGEPLAGASIYATPGAHFTATDANGLWQLSLPSGQFQIIISYIGFVSDTVTVDSAKAQPISTKLREADQRLREVVVTAHESQGVASTSRIDRDAMAHLQPTSFTDLLELLPGNIAVTPDMGHVNNITLRETGAVTATGAKTSISDDYAITSLGTMFMVDGAPINTDANLQNVPSTSASDVEGTRNSVNRGIDMRSISTDNIESVEIVRGIPSAEYGNLTSGLVNIRRVRRATPFIARFKADEYSKLFSAGKGFTLGRQTVNIDAGYLDSRVDPRNPRENFKRVNASVRAYLSWGDTESALATTWSFGGDFTGSMDNVKPDPDLNYNKIDEYRSSYNRWAFTSDLTLKPQRIALLDYISLNCSWSYELDRLERRKQVAPQRTSVAPTSMAEGVSDGRYLLQEYVADYVSDGRPAALFLKLIASGNIAAGRWLNNYKGGIEFSSTKNNGLGEVYDLSRPLSATWTTRPRAFKDIPALNIVSAYVEDNINATIGNAQLTLQAGLRAQTIAGLDSRYYLSGHLYFDPRINGVINFAAGEVARQPLRLSLGGGYGIATKMPTIDYLFPRLHYNDLIQLNYYDASDPLNHSRVSLRTYIENPVNYSLKAARNRKWEIRIGADLGANRFSVTYFNERMRSGYRYQTVYNSYSLRRYDASGGVASELTATPVLEELPFEDVRLLDGYRQVTNGSRIDKEGVEYTISTARWQATGTSLIINGAWFRSRYSNSQMLYQPVSDVVGNSAVSDRYVGLYATVDGRISEQFNTNFTFDTQIPRRGLVFTTSVQCMWWVKTRRLRDNGIPDYYISADDGRLHPFTTEAVSADPLLQYLVKSYNEAAYATQTVAPAIYLNLKATKKIGRWLSVSAFVNRIVDYLPDYTSNGLTIRRSSSAYFGMEANLSF